ncbi:hypothetical protein GCM10009841_11280 [Microlunatus panaciterrae]|uniref:Aminoglycoside phosphotransferase domain-containing protein n=1 Tax=Microlunatus panaciterrae TaxID=400768 RepID=A0ABS2RKZ8_9ACTN|nr:aminoglycoside phosphotransferase family protein [Microlunatus panaciterrae]MBM7799685.1 hypothetical protein [Microlunatus panaciterrae]
MGTTADDRDGSRLLTSAEVAGLLEAAVSHGGGSLVSWELDHVDANPNRSTTATYSAVIDWPFGRRTELLGASTRAGQRTTSDEQAVIFADGDREVAVWLYPRDPELPGLLRAAFVEDMAALLTEYDVVGMPVAAANVGLEMIGYRPRRRAVLRAWVIMPDGSQRVFFVKSLRQQLFDGVRRRHELLLAAGVPAPPIAAATPDHLLVLRELPGRPLAQAIFDPEPPCTAESLIAVLDAMPAAVAQLSRRNPWTDAVEQYAAMVSAAMPSLETRLTAMVEQILSGLRGTPPGDEPTHGDFHEGQVFVDAAGRISGILDVDTVGPGRRADDLACLVAHLSTVQRMNAEQAARVHRLVQSWVPVFDERVDPVELRLRAAAVAISLATGPYRGQEPHWERETTMIVGAAEALIRSAG